MVTLVSKNGKILTRDGSLVSGPASADCCCEEECEPCCVEILWGEFDLNGDLEKAYSFDTPDVTITITILMPEKNSRKVCADDSITVQMHREGDTAGDWQPGMWWDQLWDHVDHSPEVDGATGYYSRAGIVDWGSIGSVDDVELILELDECWVDDITQWGDIEITSEVPALYDLVEVRSCPSPSGTDCCEIPLECDDCCVYLFRGNTGDLKHELDASGNIVYYVHGSSYMMEVTITPSDPSNPERFCDGENITVSAELIGRTAAAMDNVSAGAYMEWATWSYQSRSPAIDGDGTEDLSSAGSVDWGTLAGNAGIFSIQLQVDWCEGTPEQITVQMEPDLGAGVIETLLLELLLLPCPNSSEALCCCDYKVPCCTSTCYFPVDQENPIVNSPQEPGPTEITDYIETITVDYDDTFIATLEQNGPSQHSIENVELVSVTPGCPNKVVTVSLCVWTIPVIVTDHYDEPFVGTEYEITIRAPGTMDTNWSVDVYDGYTASTYSAGGGTDSAACSGNIPFDTTIDSNDPDGRRVGSFNVSGGKSWPGGYTCVGDFLKNGSEFVNESDLADGFLNY